MSICFNEKEYNLNEYDVKDLFDIYNKEKPKSIEFKIFDFEKGIYDELKLIDFKFIEQKLDKVFLDLIPIKDLKEMTNLNFLYLENKNFSFIKVIQKNFLFTFDHGIYSYNNGSYSLSFERAYNSFEYYICCLFKKVEFEGIDLDYLFGYNLIKKRIHYHSFTFVCNYDGENKKEESIRNGENTILWNPKYFNLPFPKEFKYFLNTYYFLLKKLLENNKIVSRDLRMHIFKFLVLGL